MGGKRKKSARTEDDQPPAESRRRAAVKERVAVDDSDDEEIDEDEAFNSDDERKYGAFFTGKADAGSKDDDDDDDGSNGSSDDDDDDGDDDDDDSENDEDSQEGDGGQYMLDLLDRLDDKKASGLDENKAALRQAGHHIKESPFAASVLPAANLTLDSLMDGLKDTKGFGTVAKSLKKVATGKATMAPLAKVKADRVERRLHYEKQTGEVSQWIDAVQENRKAETLDFRPKERVETTRDVMIDSFVPTTDFEKQLQAALEEAGQKDEEAILQAEEKAMMDDLGNNVITMEEYEKRRGQLAKMRALMLYHEQKRHHMKKIKSKKYRRIRKRQREKAKESELADAVEENPDLANELQEKEEVERMKERMTLAHKNTSKWAKRVLKRGKNVDTDTRRALSAQLKKGDDLLKRIKSRMSNGEDDDDDDDSDEGDLIESARKVLEDTEKDDDTPTTGLFKLSFMQRGVDKQRQRAKEEARQLLEELEEDISGGGSEDEKKMAPPKKPKVASAKEMKGVIEDGKMVAASLTFGNSTSLDISGSISLDVGNLTTGATEGSRREYSAVLSTNESKKEETEKQEKMKETKQKKSAQQEPPSPPKAPVVNNKRKGQEKKDDEDSNPWLAAAEASSTSKKKPSKSQVTGLVDVERAAGILESTSRTIPNHKKVVPSAIQEEQDNNKDMDTSKESSQKIAHLTQDELVRRAFAGVNDQGDFAAEKQRVQEEEGGVLAGQRKKKGPDPSQVSGWGSWTGLGAPPPPPPNKKRPLPSHLAPPKKKVKRERKDDRKPAVILREGRVSKMANAYMIQKVPHPYKSREEYERSMMGGVGSEWNMAMREMTRPDVITRPGKIIKPLSMQAKRKVARAPAKF